ncbi:hypothetical protein OG539_29760 [Actinacidiphila glaucinigra]|uniref:hypothetical protein n=1 Tax=Actinacidiphila glaucinigra TaxID=235986 RepID=UPI002DD8023B|nr:hypothetical protein [Actinacidiphila glaucinigra]WSD59809.1 hypothetical protein OIE69_13160 [Actinacidiphila glaucinigra]
MKWEDRTRLRKNGRRRLIVSAVVLAALGAGYYGFQLQYPAAEAGRACGGMLPVDPVLDLTGKSRMSLIGGGFDVDSRQFDVSDDVNEPAGLAVRCDVGGAEISIETTSGAHNAYGAYTFHREEQVLPVPLDGGWQGFMVTGNRDATASVVLDCRNWAPEKGAGILVTATSPSGTEVTDDVRLALARTVTATAQRAAESTGCAAKPGDADRLTAPEAAATTVPAAEAKGTCKGLTSATEVRETPAEAAPVEECVLAGHLQLTAAYGPFNDNSQAVMNGAYGGHDKPSGVDGTSVWTSATCPGALGVGYFHASPVDGSDRHFTSNPLTGPERADLQRFAEQSAARHGCGGPAKLS